MSSELSNLLPSNDSDTESQQYTSFHDGQTIQRTTDQDPNNGVTKNNLGTFFGVYVPTILGTFGVVIFLRLSWITGQAGFLNAISMYLIAYFVVGLTVLSVFAVATNGEMKAGGTYYLISRSLGPEFGGSLGLIFFLANICGCAFFILGFVEAAVETFHLPSSYILHFAYGTATLVAVGLVVLVGANLFAKTSMGIFVLLISSIAFAFGCYWFQKGGETTGYTGMSVTTFVENMKPHYQPDENGEMYNYRRLFGILFPSVTGLMTGSNLSGDLANPGKSLPIGTLTAGITTFAVYNGLILTFAAAVAWPTLSTDPYITQAVAVADWVIVVGIFSAILSSALATLIGGSRILQALARDDIFPLGFFAVGSKKGDEPRRGVILCWCLVQVLLLIPNLNILAPYISMLYLLSFSITNFACFVCDVAGIPNFRPSFKYFHWSTALVGSIASLGVMFFIDPIESGVSLCIMVVLWLFIHFRAPSVSWGGISQALIYHQVRKYLLRLDVNGVHVKIWRPGVLLFVGSPRGLGTPHLIDATNSLKKGGLFVVGNIMVSNEWKEKLGEHTQMQKLWHDLIRIAKWKTFLDLIIAPSVRLGVQSLVLSSGVGGMRPNTVVLGFFDPHISASYDPPGKDLPEMVRNLISKFPNKTANPSMSIREYVGIIRDVNRAGKNLLIARNFEKLDKVKIKRKSGVRDYLSLISRPKIGCMTIDVWIVEDYAYSTASSMRTMPVGEPSLLTLDNNNQYQPYSDTSALIIQLGYILHTASMWHTHTKLRVLSFVRSEQQVALEKERLNAFLYKCRVEAQVIVFSPVEFDVDPNEAVTYNTVLKKQSGNTAMTFFPLPPIPSSQPSYDQYVEKVGALSHGLGPIYLVRANEKVLSTEI